MIRARRIGWGALVALLALMVALPGSTAAHPADRLVQHLMIQLAPDQAHVSVALGGGLLANELVLKDLDPNGDGQVTDAEAHAWLAMYLQDVQVLMDNTAVPLDATTATVSVPNPKQFHLGLSPVTVSFAAPVPESAEKAAHRLVVRINYLVDRTDFRNDVTEAPGVSLVDKGWPSRTTRIAFDTDPAMAGAGGAAASAAQDWGGGGLVGKAQRLLERPKTPVFIVTMLVVFLAMGALHAIQPGHGKTLVAAYLVATGGTPRDALTLAGVVTFTHTISVFALGFATLAASQVFLPAQVVPVLGFISGLIVVAMGVNMLRLAMSRRRSAASHQHDTPHAHTHHHSHDHDHDHHHHDHEGLSDEEHARLHLAEVEAAMVEETGGRRVSMRNLVTLGVSGGMAPCPDALAILLLAVGINQLAFGMVAIVAFSVGLAGVLVAFGLPITLNGPFWSRAGSTV
jgi:ABC-type nickel/cobalt efflux system permease component RcnA